MMEAGAVDPLINNYSDPFSTAKHGNVKHPLDGNSSPLPEAFRTPQ